VDTATRSADGIKLNPGVAFTAIFSCFFLNY